jgi:hypothetical protein
VLLMRDCCSQIGQPIAIGCEVFMYDNNIEGRSYRGPPHADLLAMPRTPPARHGGIQTVLTWQVELVGVVLKSPHSTIGTPWQSSEAAPSAASLLLSLPLLPMPPPFVS